MNNNGSQRSIPKEQQPSNNSLENNFNKSRMNETYANVLGELVTIMVKKGDNIRAGVYRRAQESILSIKEDIHDPQELEGKPSIGPTIIEKLHTYDKTGTLDILEKERENPENMLSDIYGVGPKKAKELVAAGITSIAQLRKQQDEVLNNVQKIGLKYYEDIQEKIPRAEIDEYASIFQEVFEKIQKITNINYEIVGSYRRGVSYSGDIDVIITSSNPNAFTEWINELISKKIIIEVLSRGNTKCLVITRLSDNAVARRIDFLYTTPEEYPFAVLYFTGSKGFNATMRGYALKKGLSLNEHGLSKIVDKKKTETLSLNIVDELGIFNYLGLVYKEPKYRIDGRSVIPKDSNNSPSPKIQKTVEKRMDEKMENDKDGSPKPKNKTRKLKVPKEPKLPKDSKELEDFCMKLLQKKDVEKMNTEENINPEIPKSSAEPISILKKETIGELKKGPILKKPMNKKTVKIAKLPISIDNEQNNNISPKDLNGSPKLENDIEKNDLSKVTSPEVINPITLISTESKTKKPRKNKTEKVPKVPKEPSKNKSVKKQKETVQSSPKDLENIKINNPEKLLDQNINSIKEVPKEPKNISQEKNRKTKKNQKEIVQSSPKELKNTETKNLNEQVLPKVRKTVKKTSENINPTPKTKTQKDIKSSLLTIKNMPKDSEDSAKSTIQEFKNQGITILEKLSQDELVNMLVVANANYYNEKGGLMTDNEYDIVKEYMEKKYPANEIVKTIGAPILDNVKNKVTLPYEMWSMDKIKPDSNALSSWMKKYKGPYVLSCKLDGVSGLYSTEGNEPKLYTRGDGKVGQDISFLLPYLKLPTKKGIVVRGEFIITKKVFQEKYAEQFANPRNLVSGIVNSKKADSKVNDLHFVTYEVIIPKLKPSEQLLKLKEDGFEVVQNSIHSVISNELLSDTLIDWRTNHQYEIDGVIVTDDDIYSRTTGNPEHAFAFKMMLSDQKAEVKVVDVIWTPSKDGFLKPRVRIEPVRLGGVTIEYATGYNAKFIEDNKIGIGSIIEIIRSGDVIPKIISVTVPAEKSKMPNEEYIWNDTHVDILLENTSSNATVQEKKLTAFFTSLEIDGLKAGNVKKLRDAGYDTIPKIIYMTKQDFEKVGYKTLAQKYVDNIREKVEGATVIQLMVASGTMGRSLGERKIEPILEAYPDILISSDTVQTKIAKVKSVKGIENKTATLFVENIPKFIEFLDTIGQTKKLTGSKLQPRESIIELDTTNPLYGKKIVMTKVRDQVIIDALKKRGASLDDTIGSKTFVLIVKSLSDVSNKTKYANEHNIPVMTPEEFSKKYLA